MNARCANTREHKREHEYEVAEEGANITERKKKKKSYQSHQWGYTKA
jgi:hypothetical protein